MTRVASDLACMPVAAGQSAFIMPEAENRCSFPREAVSACGVRLFTIWRVKAGRDYHTVAERSRSDSEMRIAQAGKNMVLVRTDAGEGVVVVKGVRHVLKRNSLLVFDFPSLEEYHTLGDRWHFWWVEFSSEEPLHLPPREVFDLPRLGGETARLEEVFDRLHSESIEQRHLAAAVWQGLSIGWWAAAGAGGSRCLTPGNLAVTRMVEAVKRNPGLEWTLADMAASGGLGAGSMRAACRQALGKTPRQVRLEIKLAHAREHLRRGDRNVSEVAESLGFCDPFHFSKAFKKRYGFNPSEARDRQP